MIAGLRVSQQLAFRLVFVFVFIFAFYIYFQKLLHPVLRGPGLIFRPVDIQSAGTSCIFKTSLDRFKIEILKSKTHGTEFPQIFDQLCLISS